MGKSSKRSHPLDTTEDQRDSDEDSGLCGSDLSSNVHKMVKFEDNCHLLKTLMNVSNETMLTHPPQPLNKRQHTYSSRSRNGKYELKIVSQPEEQHRARYMTEGSRGAIKDKTGLRHPIVKLCGYSKSCVQIQCFIGHDKQLGSSHLFYQASKISGKNSTRCKIKRVDGTSVIIMEASPHNDMQVTVDCVGILKERNVDVEQKLANLKNRTDGDDCDALPIKKRSPRCRLVFSAQIPDTNEILQVVSSPILCTQPLGTPEICKKSVSQCHSKGGSELFIIGKNFLKDAKVVWKGRDWTKVVEPDKEFLHSTHLVCLIPSYDGPEPKTQNSIDVSLSIKSGGKYSDAHRFTFTNSESVNTMTLFNGTTQNQLLMSSFEKPIIFTMIGSTIANTMDSQMISQNILPSNVTPIQTERMNSLNSDTVCFGNENSSSESFLSMITEDSQISSHFMNSTSLSNAPQITHTFDPISVMSFEDTMQEMPRNNSNTSVFTTETQTTRSIALDLMSETVSLPGESVTQYLPLNAFNTIAANLVNANDSTQMANISSIDSMNSLNRDNMSNIMQISVPVTATICTQPDQSLNSSSTAIIDTKVNTTTESIAMSQVLSLPQNPVLTSTADATPVTQATNISALSEMSDAELLCFINPATFDQI